MPDLADALADERHTQLYAAIAQLSAVEKALLTLYLDDQSYAEIAAALGLTPSHVGVKLLRGRARALTQTAARLRIFDFPSFSFPHER